MDRTKRRGICCAGVLLIALRRVREMKKEQWLRSSGAMRNDVVQTLCPNQVWVGRKTMSSYSGTGVAQHLGKASACPNDEVLQRRTVSATNFANCRTSSAVVSKEHIQRTTDSSSFHT